MPFVEVKRLTEGVAERIITAIADGLCTASGEEVRGPDGSACPGKITTAATLQRQDHH